MKHSENHSDFAAIFFDLDGTLLDTAPDFAIVLNQLRQQHQLPPIEYARVREEVSNGSKALIEMGFDLEESHPDFDAKREALLDLYLDHVAVETRLFPYLDDLLDRLDTAEIRWGIITNKPVRYAEPLLEQLKLANRCATLVCPDHVTARKPDPESLLLACTHLDVNPDQCLYVGDHQRDILAGINAGMKTIAAAYGYIGPGDQPENWGATWVVGKPEQLHHHIFLNSTLS